MSDQADFIASFVARMLAQTAPHTTLNNGEDIATYARNAAVTYFDDHLSRRDGPEACADADMSYWGE